MIEIVKEGVILARVEYHKQKTLSKSILVIGIIFSGFIIISSILLILYPFASKEKETYFHGKNPILFLGKQCGNALIEGDTIYVPFTFLKQMDDQVVFDEKSQSIIITTVDKVVQMPSESLTYFVNQKPVTLEISPLKKEDNGEFYIALETILPFYSIRYEITKGSNSIWIQKDGEEIQHGRVTKEEIHEEKLRLRTKGDLQSPYTAQTTNNESIIIEGEKGEYYFIRKENGIAGFLNKEYVEVGKAENVAVKHEIKEAALPKLNGPVQLTWEAVYSKNPNTAKIPEMSGVNIVSPTWFKLGNTEGAVHNLASIDYVKWAKSRGYQVWGLFSNSFDPELTNGALSNFETRQTIIRQLLHFSQMYQLDGYNIDFENVKKEDGPLFTQFIREAAPYLHEAGLYVSIDITFISESGNWSAFYEREKLAEIVDYMMVMAYDEHWASSPVAGSVSSLPWVEKNLQTLLKKVPNEKLVLGVPLYTRLWKEETAPDGSTKVSSQSMSMGAAKEWIDQYNLTPIYDETTGQNYAQMYVEEEKATYKIWLEDEISLKKRTELFHKYNLAGIASWSRFFAAPQAWTALEITESPTVVKQ